MKKTFLRATSFFFLLAGLATAQDNPKDLADPVPLKDITSEDLLGPNLVDFDGDGKLDLVAGNYDGEFLFFRNEGEKTAPRFAAAKKLTADGKIIKLNHW